MQNIRLIVAAVGGALSLVAAPIVGGVTIENRAVEVVGASVGSDALLAVESNRSGIIERLVADHRAALVASGIGESAFRSALAALRADHLLAASLVNTLQEVTAVVAASPVEGSALTRYVAVAPTSTLAALPVADAYLVRDGESLTVVKAAQLQLTGSTQLVGYFVAGLGSGGEFTRKDGPGSGANSWIGFTAGNNVASGPGSAVAAGTFNAATAQGSFVAAGQSNVASGISSLVIGGFDNQATAIDALIGGGAGHRATGARSVVVGGGYNLASGSWSFVGGGGRQTGSGVAGTNPEDNVAGGNFSVVTGGQGNRATGNFAVVPGGNSNLASGVSSFAAGNRAKTQTTGGSPVIHNGVFAFADNSAFDFNTANANEFAVRATGGVRFITAIDGTGVATRTTFINTNGTLVAGGNLALGTTTANTGAIYKSSLPFIHTFGTNNTFVGINSGNFTLTGADNSGLGAFALANNTTGFRNTAIGSGAMSANTTGNSNTATGGGAMQSNTTGFANTATGGGALFNNTVGEYNTGVGAGSLGSNTTGDGNTASGVNALAQTTIGDNNTAHGREALALNTIGTNNVASGYNTLRDNISGNGNTAYGTFALGTNTTGSNNTGLGFGANVAANDLVNATAIGAGALVDASNHVRIGDGSVTQIGGQVAWTNLSDRREKKDIRELSLGLDFIKSLRPVEYKMRNGNDRIDFGFIAQEVEALVGTNYNVLGIGGTAERKLSLRYTDLVAPLVKAIQQQQILIEEQRSMISLQQARLEEREFEFAALRRSVEVLLARTGPVGHLATAP